jgi:hypothetical protein
MNLKPLLIALLLCAHPVYGQDNTQFAYWGDYSGSLPPEYAWDYRVTFLENRQAEVRYCKGYSNDAPGCATAKFRLSKRKFAQLMAALTPLEAELSTNPAQDDPDPPIGGGAVYGKLTMNGNDVPLYAFSIGDSAARVAEVLDLLRQFTPQSAINSAKNKAKQP